MTAPLPAGPLVAWYGDDFTGAAAVMEVLEFSGFPSVLFLGVPDEALRARFAGRRGFGIASDARTRPPEWMDAHLPPAFAALRATGAPLLHYKLCSTFDSAPGIGSIGRAAELGLGGAADWAPMVVAAPRIGRWQAFGNLFARHAGGIARLDRHPTMSRHPVTPMDEADLCRHLARQTDLPLGLVDLVDIGDGRIAAATARARAGGARIVSFDVIDTGTLAAVGALIWAEALRSPLFVLGSQGVEDALVAAWVAAGHVLPAPRPAAAAAGPVAIVSGSCSPETDRQIAAAEASGMACLRLDLARADGPEAVAAALATVESAALEPLGRGQSVVIYTARGPADAAIAATRGVLARGGGSGLIGDSLGALLARLQHAAGLQRLGVAGGDTSGAVSRMLGVRALTAEAEIVPAVPLLAAHLADAEAPPVELVLKGGQMGPDDLFAMLLDGIAPRRDGGPAVV
jgi:uncharacterized protein YgbK (DUF1537 family)